MLVRYISVAAAGRSDTAHSAYIVRRGVGGDGVCAHSNRELCDFELVLAHFARAQHPQRSHSRFEKCQKHRRGII